jgi:predicted N-acetyltransferase YhbS
MQIEAIHEIDLTRGQDEEIATLLSDAFGPDTGYDNRSFYKQRFHMRLIMRDEDQVVGHVALLLREVRLGGQHVPIIGVGEVGTAHSHRGQGIATSLMTEAIAQSRKTLAAFMVLFGVRPLYAGLGFVNKPNKMRLMAVHELRTLRIDERCEPSLMVLPLKDEPWNNDALLDLLGPMF